MRFAAVARTVFLMRGIVDPPLNDVSLPGDEGRTLRRARARRNLVESRAAIKGLKFGAVAAILSNPSRGSVRSRSAIHR